MLALCGKNFVAVFVLVSFFINQVGLATGIDGLGPEGVQTTPLESIALAAFHAPVNQPNTLALSALKDSISRITSPEYALEIARAIDSAWESVSAVNTVNPESEGQFDRTMRFSAIPASREAGQKLYAELMTAISTKVSRTTDMALAFERWSLADTENPAEMKKAAQQLADLIATKLLRTAPTATQTSKQIVVQQTLVLAELHGYFLKALSDTELMGRHLVSLLLALKLKISTPARGALEKIFVGLGSGAAFGSLSYIVLSIFTGIFDVGSQVIDHGYLPPSHDALTIGSSIVVGSLIAIMTTRQQVALENATNAALEQLGIELTGTFRHRFGARCEGIF